MKGLKQSSIPSLATATASTWDFSLEQRLKHGGFAVGARITTFQMMHLVRLAMLGTSFFADCQSCAEW